MKEKENKEAKVIEMFELESFDVSARWIVIA